MRRYLAFVFVLGLATSARGGEEKIRGMLEKTVKPGACAQITDALSEIYYINKTDEAEKLVAAFVGKNEKVVIAGVVEQKEGDPSYFFTLKSVEPYAAKLPPAPPPAPAVPDVKAPGDAKAPAPAPEVKKEEKPDEKK